MKIQLEQRLNLKPCPICGSNPLLSSEDMGQPNGRGYPGDFAYYFYCPSCQKFEGNSFTTVYTTTKKECIEKAAESWNEEVESWNEKILNYKKDKKMQRLDEFDIENLTDDWVFYSLSNFIEEIEHGCFIDDDGYGEFIYINKNGRMYLKENESFSPSEIVKMINFVYKNNKFASCIEVAKALRKKYSNDDYKLFAIFWYNK